MSTMTDNLIALLSTAVSISNPGDDVDEEAELLRELRRTDRAVALDWPWQTGDSPLPAFDYYKPEFLPSDGSAIDLQLTEFVPSDGSAFDLQLSAALADIQAQPADCTQAPESTTITRHYSTSCRILCDMTNFYHWFGVYKILPAELAERTRTLSLILQLLLQHKLELSLSHLASLDDAM